MRHLAGRTIVVENRVGALGNIATEYTARAKPDGYTVQVASGSALAANMHMFKQPPVDVHKQLQIVGSLSRSTMIIAVRPDSPYKTVQELTAGLREKGDRASYAYATVIAKLIGAMYMDKANLKAIEVAYKSGDEFMNDLAGGRLDFAVADHVQATAQARAGRIRLLAVAQADRLKVLPELPTMKEAGVDIDIRTWWGMMAPINTPAPIIAQLNGWLNQIVASPEAKTFLNNIGTDPWVSTPADAQAYMRGEIDAWKEYVKIAKIEPQ
jgi:tripartite-type tricarboxylate transporter receptor subunit TctC